MKNLRSRGLTLIELIVVVAILAVLAMIIIPKLDGLTANANHAAASASVSDTGRYIQTWKAMKTTSYPDGWDSLTDGTSVWNTVDVANKTKGLHTTFGGGTTGKFTASTLSATDIAGLVAIGVATMYDVDKTVTNKRPGDMFTIRRSLSSGGTGSVPAVIVNAGSTAGVNIINHFYRDNAKKGTSGVFYDASGAAVPDSAPRKLLALGLGPMNDIVGKLTQEAPSYANVDSSLVYNRNIALFEVGGSRAVFKGVVATDGDLLDDLTTYMNKDIQ
ncbi:MAG: prepilin-type N-terminal cleavage/methylation domain-containing protein [Planctomycetaceae bacterium]|nr:prepilin-type N-terminal cleavage/methylation domain-containing protein [Planctomycetaceae bacterium]